MALCVRWGPWTLTGRVDLGSNPQPNKVIANCVLPPGKASKNEERFRIFTNCFGVCLICATFIYLCEIWPLQTCTNRSAAAVWIIWRRHICLQRQYGLMANHRHHQVQPLTTSYLRHQSALQVCGSTTASCGTSSPTSAPRWSLPSPAGRPTGVRVFIVCGQIRSNCSICCCFPVVIYR